MSSKHEHHHKEDECEGKCEEGACDCEGGECKCGGGEHECCHGGGDCKCGHGGCECDCKNCGCGHQHFQRCFRTKEEQIARLDEYLKELKLEAQAVEERIADLRK